MEHVDVLIVGAGLSGIGAAVHLKRNCPDRSLAIVEARDTMGGTWDLFRYPGIRSDSDMYTLGYAFRPWTHAKAIADGPSIRAYIRDTARDEGLESRIRYGHKVVRASWSSETARWTVDIERGPERAPVQISCAFLYMCAGYYRYDRGHDPQFEGRERFQGTVVHPQFWPEGLDYHGKRVVVIGSGATAVTLVPEMARDAAQVTMLQRSPTYVVARPGRDAIAQWLRRWLPERTAYFLTRWKNVLLGMFFFRLARKRPERVAERMIQMVREALPPGYDVERHFKPSYKPWDQRVCLVPDGDLFTAIREGRASVVTDRIAHFDETGIRLASGGHVEADIIVTATGLELEVLGGLEAWVDGRRVDWSRTLQYKGAMFSDVPNLISAFGYTNASWTLKADLTAEYACRLLNHMKRHGFDRCMPHNEDPSLTVEPPLEFSSGYVVRALPRLPKQGSKLPWKLFQNYAKDIRMLRHGEVDDGVMRFDRAGGEAVVPTHERLAA